MYGFWGPFHDLLHSVKQLMIWGSNGFSFFLVILFHYQKSLPYPIFRLSLLVSPSKNKKHTKLHSKIIVYIVHMQFNRHVQFVFLVPLSLPSVLRTIFLETLTRSWELSLIILLLVSIDLKNVSVSLFSYFFLNDLSTYFIYFFLFALFISSFDFDCLWNSFRSFFYNFYSSIFKNTNSVIQEEMTMMIMMMMGFTLVYYVKWKFIG